MVEVLDLILDRLISGTENVIFRKAARILELPVIFERLKEGYRSS